MELGTDILVWYVGAMGVGLDGRFRGEVMEKMTNLFNGKEKRLPRSVVVHLRDNPFDRTGETQLPIVMRETVSDDSIVTEMMQHTDCMRRNDAVMAMSAFVDAVKAILGNGNAVHISGLGTFYLMCTGTVEKRGENKGELGAMKVAFEMDGSIDSVLENTVVATVEQSDSRPEVEEAADMSTQRSGELRQDAWGELLGKRMRVLGKREDGCGLFIVPLGADGSHRPDGSDWVRVEDENIHCNVPGRVVFKVPKVLGCEKCRVAIRTKAWTRGRAGKTPQLLKHPRFSVSEAVFTVAL